MAPPTRSLIRFFAPPFEPSPSLHQARLWLHLISENSEKQVKSSHLCTLKKNPRTPMVHAHQNLTKTRTLNP